MVLFAESWCRRYPVTTIITFLCYCCMNCSERLGFYGYIYTMSIGNLMVVVL